MLLMTLKWKCSFQSATDRKQNPCKENIQIQQATPPSFYIKEPCLDVWAAAVCKTAKGSSALQYMSIWDAEKEQAELIVTMGHTIQDHPRTKGSQEQDLWRLSPGQEKKRSTLSKIRSSFLKRMPQLSATRSEPLTHTSSKNDYIFEHLRKHSNYISFANCIPTSRIQRSFWTI